MNSNYKTKRSLSDLFDIPIKTINNDLTEMRRLNNFKNFILRPTHKRVYIDVEGYEAFLKYKQTQHEKLR
jgi:hypothetical protein